MASSETGRYPADWKIDRIDAVFEIQQGKQVSKKNDYNISPSRHIHTGDAETYRPIARIVEELNIIEAEARETDNVLREILGRIGV